MKNGNPALVQASYAPYGNNSHNFLLQSCPKGRDCGDLEGWLSSVLASSILQPALEATCILAPLLVDVPERMFLIVG